MAENKPKLIMFRPSEADEKIIELILSARPSLSGRRAAALREGLYVWQATMERKAAEAAGDTIPGAGTRGGGNGAGKEGAK